MVLAVSSNDTNSCDSPLKRLSRRLCSCANIVIPGFWYTDIWIEGNFRDPRFRHFVRFSLDFRHNGQTRLTIPTPKISFSLKFWKFWRFSYKFRNFVYFLIPFFWTKNVFRQWNEIPQSSSIFHEFLQIREKQGLLPAPPPAMNPP